MGEPLRLSSPLSAGDFRLSINGVEKVLDEPLAVSPKVAFAAIGVGNTRGYKLINDGSLEAFKIGRCTRITWSSVKRLVDLAPRLAA